MSVLRGWDYKGVALWNVASALVNEHICSFNGRDNNKVSILEL